MRLIIADDHVIVRRGLQQIIAACPNRNVVGEAGSAEELLALLRRTPVDVLILDVSLGERSGIDLLPQIREIQPNVAVLLLSMHAEEHYALRALRAGAAGYIQKDRSPEELVAAIERVASGLTYVSDAVLTQMAASLTGGVTERPHEKLSTREFQVFLLIADGKSVKDVAEALNVSAKTVSTYRARILEKTGFRTNADIITYALRNGLR